MAGIQWISLDLWKASKLQTETAEVTRIWEAALASGDEDYVRALKASIEARNDELEHFFVRNATDQRAVLFEKQRLALRALLQRAASAAHRAASPPRGAAASGSPGWRGSPPGGARAAAAAERSAPAGPAITDDTRLDLPGFLEWFRAEGRRQVPGLPSKHLEEVFDAVVDWSDEDDGCVSARGLRRWFFSVFRKRGWKPGASSASKASGGRRSRVPIYGFEAKAMARSGTLDASGVSSAASLGASGAAGEDSRIGFEGSRLDFCVVLTPEEHAALSLRVRALEAEEKDLSRRELARSRASRAKKEGISRGGLFTPDLSRDALLKDSAFVDSDKMEKFIFRHAQPSAWTDKEADFKTR